MHAVTLHPVKLFLPLSLLDVPYIYGKSSRRLFAWSAVDTNPQSEPPSVVDGRTNGLDTKVRTPLHAAQAPSVPWLDGGPLWKYNGRVCVTRHAYPPVVFPQGPAIEPRHTWSLGCMQWGSYFRVQPIRPAVHDAWRFTLGIRVYRTPGE